MNGERVWSGIVGLAYYRQQSLARRMIHKLAKWYYGPYKIVKRIRRMVYRLQLSSESKIHNIPCISSQVILENPTKNFPSPEKFTNISVKSKAFIDVKTMEENGKQVVLVLVEWEGLNREEVN